jgi:tetratricopeptide (TPR) repeat protein
LTSAYVAETSLRKRVRESEISAFWYGQAWQWMKEHPRPAAALLLKKSLFLVQAKEVSNNRDLFHHRDAFPLLRLLSVISFGLISPFILAGAVLALADKTRRWLWPLLFLGCYSVSVVAFFVTTRYRLPMLPMAAVLAGLCLETMVMRLRGPVGWRAAMPLFALLAICAAVVNMPWPAWNDRPLRSAMRYNLGLALAEKGRWEDAERELRAAVAIKDHYPEAHFWLGQSLLAQNRGKEAAAEFRLCRDQAPDYAPASYALYQVYLAMAGAAPAGSEERQEFLQRAWEALHQAHLLAPELYPPVPEREGKE